VSGRDEEFRQLFVQDAGLRLDRLGRRLLELEAAGGGEELVGELFREVHALKGSAGVVGLDGMALVAHGMEDLLQDLRDRSGPVTPTLVDALLAAADGLKAMLGAVLAGQDDSRAAAALAARLRDAARDASGGAAGDAARDASGGAAGGAPATGGHEPVRAPAAVAGSGPVPRPVVDAVVVPGHRLDELVRLVGETDAARLRLGGLLGEQPGVDPAGVVAYRELTHGLTGLREQALRARMVAVATITDPLRRAVRDLSRTLGKRVRWEVRGGDTELDRSVLQQLADPLLHAVRNAVDHGIEHPDERLAAGKPAEGAVRLEAAQVGPEVVLTVTDDGRGVDLARVREEVGRRGTGVAGLRDEDLLLEVFRPGFSTAGTVSGVSGRGVGLDAVRAAVEAVRGRVTLRSGPGEGTELRIVVPITLAVLSCLLVEAGGQRFALPMPSVVRALAAGGALVAAAGRPVLLVGDGAVPASGLGRTLWGSEHADGGGGDGVAVVVGDSRGRRHAFVVDRLVGQRDVVVKGLPPLLPPSDLLAGAAVEPDGTILLVLDVTGLVERARAAPASAPAPVPVAEAMPAPPESGPPPPRPATILVVDDAPVIRQLQRSILERAGYEVRTAVDGVDALARLAESPCDLVVSDIEMPRMDGFALVEAIRADATLANLPVLILTSRATERDRRRGLEAGADGYIVKSDFDEGRLLGAIGRFVGGRQ
jgi:two-component system chemotaxis sensor kinase CheA